MSNDTKKINLDWSDLNPETDAQRIARVVIESKTLFEGATIASESPVVAKETDLYVEQGSIYEDMTGQGDGEVLVIGFGEVVLPGYDKAVTCALVADNSPRAFWLDVNDLEEV